MRQGRGGLSDSRQTLGLQPLLVKLGVLDRQTGLEPDGGQQA